MQIWQIECDIWKLYCVFLIYLCRIGVLTIIMMIISKILQFLQFTVVGAGVWRYKKII